VDDLSTRLEDRTLASRARSLGTVRQLLVGALSAGSLAGTGLALASPVLADGVTVTRGELRAFAAGSALDVDGRAQMIRTSDGRTIVTVHIEGLAPSTAYGAHVHQAACDTGDADGHFKFDPAGAAAPPNEIWPAFTTNASGIGNGFAIAEGTAGPNAVSVVIHAPGGAKIACADLD
jgi:hypothetical protein